MPGRHKQIVCACCNRPGRHDTNGWIKACARRWRNAGRPDTGPPPPRRHRGPANRTTTKRRTEYAALAALGRSEAYIAWKLSVSERTVRRYAAAFQNSQTQQKAAA
ncbi:hypothetical protein [Streptosporangium canum]|uniref:hypothetical protein n=1 Tax=Streptosporangium canum TaxID=324952 RepID=UPI0033BB2C31